MGARMLDAVTRGAARIQSRIERSSVGGEPRDGLIASAPPNVAYEAARVRRFAHSRSRPISSGIVAESGNVSESA